MSIDEYDSLADSQGYLCAICGRECMEENPVPRDPNRLYVDHNHITGSVRGLLCNNCNLGLGAFLDNSSLLEIARTYLDANRTY